MYITCKIDTAEQRQLLEDYLLMFQGQTFDAATTVIGVKERWGIRIDWHEAAIVLQDLRRRGEAILVGHRRSGLTQYVIEHQGGGK